MTILVKAQRPSLKFNHTSLMVTDLERSSSFYEGILFLEQIDVPKGYPIMRWFSLNNGLQLHIIKGNSNELKLHKAIHFALTTNEFDGYLKHLGKNQITYSIGSSPYRSVRNIFIQDPDKNWIEKREELEE